MRVLNPQFYPHFTITLGMVQIEYLRACRRGMWRFGLGGFLVLESSSDSSHVVFDRSARA